jgi:hypothetical protein
MLAIYGCSDDLVEIEGDFREEISATKVTLTLGRPEASPGQDAAGVVVQMRYSPDWARACWVASIGPLAEGVPIPWAVRVVHATHTRDGSVAYSARVEVDCPPGTPIWRKGRRLNPEIF